VNKYEDIVNLQGAEAYRGGRQPTAGLVHYLCVMTHSVDITF